MQLFQSEGHQPITCMTMQNDSVIKSMGMFGQLL